MKCIPNLAATFAVALLACTSAQALEPFASYDTFAASSINPSLWNERELSRTIKGGTLNLMQRNWGLDTADSGTTFFRFSDNLKNPATVTALKAKITITALEVNACAANPAIGSSQARISGSFFNIGSPVPGSSVGDLNAQIRLIRNSNSADAADVLRVLGTVFVCTSADCSTATAVGSAVDLGTVSVGVPTTVQMQWDQPLKRFKFSRDGGAFSGNVAYTQTDASPPGSPVKQVSTRLDLPSCLSSPRVTGMMDARFDNIAVNSSAVP